MIKVAIEEVITDEFCQDRLAPANAAYEDKKARILGDSKSTKKDGNCSKNPYENPL